MISSPSDSPMISLWGGITRGKILKGSPPALAICESGVGLNGRFFDLQAAVSRKQCKIRPRLLLNTNRKPHKHFRLVPKSTTLDDLELTLNSHYAFFTLHICLSEPTAKIWMTIDSYSCQLQKCSPEIVVSTEVRFMRIFLGVRWGGGIQWEWGRFFGDFQPICCDISKTVHSRQSYYRTLIGNHMQAIEWYHFRWPWVTSDPDFKHRADLSATAGLSCTVTALLLHH